MKDLFQKTMAQNPPSHIEHLDYRPLFPTPLFIGSLAAPVAERVNSQLADLILEKSRQETKKQITNVGGWQSDTRLLEWGGAGVGAVLRAIRGVIDEVTLKLDSGPPQRPVDWKIYGWANLNRKGDFNLQHTHPGSFWSASYYVRVPAHARCGEFQAIDPRGTLPITYNPQLRIGMDDTLSCGGHFLHHPKAGEFLIFPSWLPHAVMPHDSDEPRMSLAFNFSV